MHRSLRGLSLVSILSLIASVFVLAGPSSAALARGAPAAVSIPGTLDQAIGCANDWDPACSQAQLTAQDATNTLWTGTWDLPAGSYQYKAAINDSWAESYGQNTGSGNINLNVGQPQQVIFAYDDATHWVTDSVNSVIATTPGDFQTYLGCSGNWDPSCLHSWLEDPSGSGTYSFSTSAIPAGSYQVKVAIDLSWNVNYGQNGAENGANINFAVPYDGAKVTFSFNPTTHLLSVSAGQEPDNNVEYDGLGHNSQDTLYRTPFGAVTPGTPVTLRFRTYHQDVTSVTVRFYDTATSHQFFQNMTVAAANVSCRDPNTTRTCDYWQATITPAQPTTLYYRFIVRDGTAVAYYADTSQELGGWGVATPNEIDNSYAITVYDPGFQVIPWMRDAVIYQIFPDRFNTGGVNTVPSPSSPRYSYPPNAQDQIINKSWDSLPEGYCADYVNPATPCTESAQGRDYFGGNLVGIIQKIPYLQSLGVTVMYLNPIFQAASNHGYDTQDYFKIAPNFGNLGNFHALVSAAHAHGIRIILDGVFNHVSSDSPYFNRYNHFSTAGACNSVSSPYRDWFTFHEVAPGTGTCAGSAGPRSATYDDWDGFDSLPVLNKSNPQVRGLIYADANSVVRYWLNQGADGWRFDVMPDPSFPSDFWQGVRTAVKSTNPSAVMICECWQKGDVLNLAAHGNQADATMDYRFRDAILGFFGTVDNKGFPDDGQSNQPPSVFAEKLMSEREDYPDSTYYTSMKLMDSHDTERILWALTPGQYNREDREFNAANVAQGKQLLRMAAVVQMTTPGAPTIYYGDEVGLTGSNDPDNRRPFPWTTGQGQYYGAGGDHSLFDSYQSLIAVRSSHPVLSQGSLHFLLTDDTNRTLAYLMRSTSDAALVALNRNSAAETLTINTAGWLPSSVHLLGAYGPISDVTANNSVVTLSLPAETAAILVPAAGQNLTAPVAPSSLSATAGDSEVSLSWNGVAGATSYAVYSSPVTGGGYQLAGTTSGTTFTDTTASNGQRYYYVVRAYSPAGVEGPASTEASALPSYPIGWAILQYPKTLTRTVGVAYTTYYGRVYVQGVTDAGGDPAQIMAQVGFGPKGSDPSTWSTWTSMANNPSCLDCGHNYEYQGNIRPPAASSAVTYDVLVRFSTDLGASWTYADQNGVGAATPGVLVANPNPDQTSPAAPSNLQVTDWSPSSISLQWGPVGDAAEYWIYRATSSGTYGSPIAMIPSAGSSYTDTTVDEGTAYYYVVKAVDAALNVSPASNEVSQTAGPKLVAVTFNTAVPATTPAASTIYIAGDFGASSGYPTWNPAGLPMTWNNAHTQVSITLHILDQTSIQYKYTLGSWDYVEKAPDCSEIGNRTLTVAYGAAGTQTQNDTIANWRNVSPCGA